ncbi:autophagy-related protein [Favolaschia claudopus]|uniref:Autophagy-related protein n=1 Tax=Favolaschia claudopus TaxID=2862362 RepID=A0AAV9Z9J2_9AGAR
MTTESSKLYRKRLNGWLSYAFASEVFVIVSLTLFLPICLEQFARDNGYLLPDKTNPCSAAIPAEPTGRCVVKIGWLWIDTASFSLYVYSISVALQALTVISMGGIADHPPHRKLLLLTFAFLGALAATAFLILPSSSPVWLLCALFASIANVGFGASIVAMNSYLPSLAKDAPEVVQIMTEIQESEDSGLEEQTADSPDAPLIAPSAERTALRARYDAELARAMSRISSFGIAMGYAAGICLLIVALIPVTKMHGSTFSLRLAIGLSGIWWAVFTLPAAIWLPGASAAASEAAVESADGKWSVGREIVGAWKRLGGMLHPREIKRLRNTFKYLAAWFLLSDGFTTITSTAVLFGKTVLHMEPTSLILIGVLTPFSGILGSLLWPRLQRQFGWSNLRIIILLVILASVIPAYGCLGFLIRGRYHFGGLTTPGEMFGLALYFGSIYGAFQSYARAFYAELLPPGEEARWYGLYSITDKSSSFIGPLVVGLISDATGNIRYAFFFLVFMIWLSVPLLASVDIEEGRKDAREYIYQ